MMLHLFYFVAGIIFYTLGILSLINFYKLRFYNDLFLCLFFFSIGWIFPSIIFFPDVFQDQSQFIVFGMGANYLIGLAILFLNLFLDYTISEHSTFWSQSTLFCIGIIYGILISSNSYNIFQGTSIYGEYFVIIFTNSSGLFVYYLFEILAIGTTLRFIIVGFRLTKRIKNPNLMKKSRKLIYLMAGGMIIWLILIIFKRIWPNFFIGIDILALSIFYLFVVHFHLKNRHLLFFLPGTLERAILIHRTGLPILDYEFKTQKIISWQALDNEPKDEIFRSLLYGATEALKTALEKSIQFAELQTITFSGSEIILYNTSYVHWMVITHRKSPKYERLITLYANSVENLCRDEFKSMETGMFVSDLVEKTVSSFLENIF